MAPRPVIYMWTEREAERMLDVLGYYAFGALIHASEAVMAARWLTPTLRA